LQEFSVDPVRRRAQRPGGPAPGNRARRLGGNLSHSQQRRRRRRVARRSLDFRLGRRTGAARAPNTTPVSKKPNKRSTFWAPSVRRQGSGTP